MPQVTTLVVWPSCDNPRDAAAPFYFRSKPGHRMLFFFLFKSLIPSPSAVPHRRGKVDAMAKISDNESHIYI